MLYASEPAKITVNASCYDSRNVLRGKFFNTDSRKEKFTISFSSKTLDQSKDATHTNTDGYVDITEEKYAFILGRDSYRLDGSVVRSRSDNINQFVSDIYSDSENLINTKELYALKNSQNLKLMQKINLVYKSGKTNMVAVYFDKKLNESYMLK